MQGESSSAESIATTSSGPALYKCGNCCRYFKSTRARSGHQLAHRKERISRRKMYAPATSAVWIPLIPSEGEQKKGPVGAAAEGTGSSDDHVKLDDDNGINAEGNEPKAKPTPDYVPSKRWASGSAESSPCRRGNKRPVGDQKSNEHPDDHQPQKQQQQQQQLKRLCTRDLLALWNRTRNNVEDGIGGVEDFNLNVEWQLRSDQYAEEVDLELKLGF